MSCACIPGYLIKKEALRIYDEIHPANPAPDFVFPCSKQREAFIASDGWLQNFKQSRSKCQQSSFVIETHIAGKISHS